MPSCNEEDMPKSDRCLIVREFGLFHSWGKQMTATIAGAPQYPESEKKSR